MKIGLKGQQTVGLRLRKDQKERLERIRQYDPEIDRSTALRQGLDLWLEKKEKELKICNDARPRSR